MEMMIMALSALMDPRRASAANTAITTIVTMVFTFNKFDRFFQSSFIILPPVQILI